MSLIILSLVYFRINPNWMYLKILTSQCISNLVSRESKAFPLKDKHAKKYIKQGSNPGGGGVTQWMFE